MARRRTSESLRVVVLFLNHFAILLRLVPLLLPSSSFPSSSKFSTDATALNVESILEIRLVEGGKVEGGKVEGGKVEDRRGCNVRVVVGTLNGDTVVNVNDIISMR